MAQFGFGGPVGGQGVRIVHLPTKVGIGRRLGQHLDHRGDGAARHATDHLAHHERGVAELAGAVLQRPFVQRVHGEIRRDGIESAGMHDAGSGVGGLLVVQVDALADEHRLAGEVGVVGARRGACGDQRQPVLAVGPDGGDHHPGARGHRVQRRGRRRRRRRSAATLLRPRAGCPARPAAGRGNGRRARCAPRRPPAARYSAVSLPTKPVAPYRTMSNSRCSTAMHPTYRLGDADQRVSRASRAVRSPRRAGVCRGRR